MRTSFANAFVRCCSCFFPFGGESVGRVQRLRKTNANRGIAHSSALVVLADPDSLSPSFLSVLPVPSRLATFCERPPFNIPAVDYSFVVTGCPSSCFVYPCRNSGCGRTSRFRLFADRAWRQEPAVRRHAVLTLPAHAF